MYATFRPPFCPAPLLPFFPRPTATAPRPIYSAAAFDFSSSRLRHLDNGRVVVVGGGRKKEREVSRVCSAAVEGVTLAFLGPDSGADCAALKVRIIFALEEFTSHIKLYLVTFVHEPRFRCRDLACNLLDHPYCGDFI